MEYQYPLSVAGIRILLETDHPLVENASFEPFRIQDAVPDLRVRIQQAEHLPDVPAALMFSDECVRIARGPSGHPQKFYYERPSDPVHYAVAEPDYQNGFVQVNYLPGYRRCVSEIQNCFYHIGFESVLLRRNMLCLHAACVDTPMGGILFSGVSGIGKSTQAELWQKYRGARQINGDRPILARTETGWLAWGSPYAGSSKCYVNGSCPISAVVLLKQAAACSLRKLSPSEAFRGVWAGLTVHSWESDYVEAASELTVDFISGVPVFEYGCTPDKAAVTFLEQALRKEFAV